MRKEIVVTEKKCENCINWCRNGCTKLLVDTRGTMFLLESELPRNARFFKSPPDFGCRYFKQNNQWWVNPDEEHQTWLVGFGEDAFAIEARNFDELIRLCEYLERIGRE